MNSGESMIVVITRMKVKPEQEKDFVSAIRSMLEPTRVEPGCVSYRFVRDINDPLSYLLIEEWEDRESIKKHILSRGFRRLLGLMDLLDAPPDVKFHSVSSTAGLEYVSNVFESNVYSEKKTEV
jgi:quinol monooxygenase YgiN